MYRVCQPKVSHSDKPPPDSTFIIQRSDDGFWTEKVRARLSSRVDVQPIESVYQTSMPMLPGAAEAESNLYAPRSTTTGKAEV
jgi:hypothetical protein